jgi:hypothetical protein
MTKTPKNNFLLQTLLFAKSFWQKLLAQTTRPPDDQTLKAPKASHTTPPHATHANTSMIKTCKHTLPASQGEPAPSIQPLLQPVQQQLDSTITSNLGIEEPLLVGPHIRCCTQACCQLRYTNQQMCSTEAGCADHPRVLSILS